MLTRAAANNFVVAEFVRGTAAAVGRQHRPVKESWRTKRRVQERAALIRQLWEDGAMTQRQIAARVGCSEWLVSSVVRAGHKQPEVQS
jgi:hypothetical protein